MWPMLKNGPEDSISPVWYYSVSFSHQDGEKRDVSPEEVYTGMRVAGDPSVLPCEWLRDQLPPLLDHICELVASFPSSSWGSSAPGTQVTGELTVSHSEMSHIHIYIYTYIYITTHSTFIRYTYILICCVSYLTFRQTEGIWIFSDSDHQSLFLLLAEWSV